MATSASLVFESTHLDVIDRDGEPWLRGPQIAGALGFNRDDRIADLFNRNYEEFTESMTALVKLPTAGGEQMVRIFSLRGAHLLGMLARTDKAAAFRRWVLDVLEQQSIQKAPALPPIDPRSLLWVDDGRPDPSLTPRQQRMVAAHAASLAQEAFGIVHNYLLRVLSGRQQQDGTVPDHRVEDTLANTTLGSALARKHYENLRWLTKMAEATATLVGEYRAELDRELAPLAGMQGLAKSSCAPMVASASSDGRRELTAANPDHEQLVNAWEDWCANRSKFVGAPDEELQGVSFQCLLDAFHMADPEDLGRKVFEIQHIRRAPHFAQVAKRELGISRQHAYRLLYRFRAELIEGARRLTGLRKQGSAT